MIRKILLSATLAILLLAPETGFAGVKVRFVHPERYTDAGPLSMGPQDATLAEFRAYFQKLGGQFLAPGQNLTIDVLDIDLAGH